MAHDIRIKWAKNILGLQPEDVFTFRFTAHNDRANFEKWLRKQQTSEIVRDQKNGQKLIHFNYPDIEEAFIRDWVNQGKAVLATDEQVRDAFKYQDPVPTNREVFAITYKPPERRAPEWVNDFVMGKGQDFAPILYRLRGPSRSVLRPAEYGKSLISTPQI